MPMQKVLYRLGFLPLLMNILSCYCRWCFVYCWLAMMPRPEAALAEPKPLLSPFPPLRDPIIMSLIGLEPFWMKSPCSRQYDSS